MGVNTIWDILTVGSAIFAFFFRGKTDTFSAWLSGASGGVALTISLAGPLCLWAGLGNLLQNLGLLRPLGRLLSPALLRLFPSCRTDPVLTQQLSANFCANLLGLGNAATPMGIRAAQRLRDPAQPNRATGELCRLVVLNTASVQLLPTTVASVRASAGAARPFDILPCVWITSLCSVCAGLTAAGLLERCWRHG